MQPGDSDFRNVDMHGLQVTWKDIGDEQWEPRIELPDVTIYIERRNFYCDRGRYGFWAESRSPEKVCIDFADAFPRYFFSLQRAMDECNDWVVFRKLMEPQS